MYEIVEINEMQIVGLGIKTTNMGNKCLKDISATWKMLMETIDKPKNALLVGLYTEYEGDYTAPYKFIAGYEVRDGETSPELLEIRTIPAGKYAKFEMEGDPKVAVGALWQKIWASGLPRAYGSDFELYEDCSGENNAKKISIYISIKEEEEHTMNYCQSCGMPMENESMHGTEGNGAKTSEYCMYCYTAGEFTQPNVTMDQMMDLCLPFMVQAGIEENQAKNMMAQTFPMLKRWKK